VKRPVLARIFASIASIASVVSCRLLDDTDGADAMDANLQAKVLAVSLSN